MNNDPYMTRVDNMLRYFAQTTETIHYVMPEQAQLIKDWWDVLHWFTGKHFSFSDDYSKLRTI